MPCGQHSQHSSRQRGRGWGSKQGCASSQLRAAPRQDEAISWPAPGSSGDTKEKRKAWIGTGEKVKKHPQKWMEEVTITARGRAALLEGQVIVQSGLAGVGEAPQALCFGTLCRPAGRWRCRQKTREQRSIGGVSAHLACTLRACLGELRNSGEADRQQPLPEKFQHNRGACSGGQHRYPSSQGGCSPSAPAS